MSITYEKTWSFDFGRDYTPSTALDLTRYTMWLLASQLTGNTGGLTLGLWTLYASSDSVTSGTDSTDRWTLAGPYDGTKIVRGSGAAIHSWIVLQSPSMNGSNWYMILSFNSANNAAIRLSFCKTAPTGGSTTVTPTSTDQWWPNSSSIAAADYTINGAGIHLSRFSFGLSSGGDFYFVGCRQKFNFPNLIIQLHALSNYPTGNLVPIWNQMIYSAVGTLNYPDINFSAGAFLSSAAASGTVTRKYDLTSNARVNMILSPMYTPSANAVFPAQTGSASAAPKDIGTGRRFIYPAYIFQCVSGGTVPVFMGRLADVFVSSDYANILPDGISVSPVTGTIKYAKVNGLLLPANAMMDFG